MRLYASTQTVAPASTKVPRGTVNDLATDRRRPALDAGRGFVLVIAFVLTTPSWDRAMAALPPSAIEQTVVEQATHAAWNGFHFIDWGFPAFIIHLAGSMTLSRERRRKLG